MRSFAESVAPGADDLLGLRAANLQYVGHQPPGAAERYRTLAEGLGIEAHLRIGRVLEKPPALALHHVAAPLHRRELLHVGPLDVAQVPYAPAAPKRLVQRPGDDKVRPEPPEARAQLGHRKSKKDGNDYQTVAKWLDPEPEQPASDTAEDDW